MASDEPSETHVSKADLDAKPAGAPTNTCPSCGRQVEAGFKFCDYCGAKLEVDPLEDAKSAENRPAPHEEKSTSLLRRLRPRRRKHDDAASALGEGLEPPDTVPPPLPPSLDEVEMPPPKPAAPTPPRPTSQMTKAEDLRAATSEGRAGISGRLRWREESAAQATDATRASQITTTWRAVPTGAEATGPHRFTFRDGMLFIFHLLVSFVVGAVLVGIAAVVASLMSDGRVALLEVRGLPIFIAGASAIIVFALLRTGPRRGLAARAVAISVLVGFVVLVTGVAFGYQPSLMAEAQSRLDRALGVFGGDVVQGIDRFEADVDQWNAEVHQYSDVELTKLSKARDTLTDAAKLAKAEETFRVDASGSEEALDGILKRMRSHADGIGNAPLREALTDLTGIFTDELSGIHLITRGFVNDDQALISSGDTRFKDATQRAVEFFQERVRPILERGNIDAESLGLAIEDLRG
jgi:hypothetical protein